MIISKTPFRISFFGGGTDYPVWYEKYGGAVLSTTIDKYCYISLRYLPPFFPYKYRIRYSVREEIQTVAEIQHPSVRECLTFARLNEGIEMVHTSDIPALSGIGSSSSFTVGFLHSLYALLGRSVSKRQLGLDAIYVEQNLIKENVGSQDQIAAAFGGLNKIEFGGPEKICVESIAIPRERKKVLQDYLMLFFTGYARVASEIAKEQIENTENKKQELSRMREMVDEGITILKEGDLEDFGRLLHESWMLKRTLSSRISTNAIDAMYEAGLKAGALGGKILGAGGGGFLLFFVKPEDRQNVLEALSHLLYVPVKFEENGSQIIYKEQSELV